MNKILIIAFLFCLSSSYSQVSTDKDYLQNLYDLTTSQMNSVTSPYIGTIIYNTDRKTVYVFSGTKWVKLSNYELTSIFDSDSTISYIDGIGDTTVINIKKMVDSLETLTVLSLNGDTLVYKDENGNSSKLYLQDLDTTNEIITNVTYENDTLRITEADSTFSVRVRGGGNVEGVVHERNDTLQIVTADSIFSVNLANTMAEIYDSVGGYTLTGSFTDITLGKESIVDSNYVTTTNSISVKSAGRYKITYRVTVGMESGNNRSGSEYQLVKNGSTIIPGTYSGAYHRHNVEDVNSANVVKVVELDAGDKITVQGRKYNGLGVLKTKPSGSSLLIERL